MNIRVLDKNDKAALEQLIYTIENALPVPEWWIPIDDIERSHFFVQLPATAASTQSSP